MLIIWVMFSALFPSALAKMHYIIIEPQTDISALILKQLGYTVEEVVFDGVSFLTIRSTTQQT